MKKSLAFLLPTLFLVSCSSGGVSSSAVSSSSQESTPSASVVSANTLVAYFSVTNHTKKIAGYAQEYLGSEIFEILPKQEYTAADINYGNDDCRANKEQKDAKARPEIKNAVADMSKYDTVVLGYPIWWGQAPKIMYTFMESYDFSGKIIIPFCTSGSSPIGDSATSLSQSASKATWLEGKRFGASSSKEEVTNWLSQYKKEVSPMKLAIDGKELKVAWESNDSVKAIKEALPVTINMNEFGGFEQTGPMGFSVTRSDTQMDVVPGDIVLYGGDAISVFYNRSAWTYTRLGHIDLSEEELIALLKKPSVTFTLKGE